MEGLWNLDQQLFHAINSGWHSPVLDRVFWALTCTGIGWVQAVLILTLLAWKRRYVLPLLLTLALSGFVLSDGMKRLIERDRPSNLPDAILAPDERIFAHSFPSGHTTTSFAIAFMLLLLSRRDGKSWVGWLALLWACLVGLSRTYRGVHWPTDVLGGACVGLVGAIAVYLVFDAFGWLPVEGADQASTGGPAEA